MMLAMLCIGARVLPIDIIRHLSRKFILRLFSTYTPCDQPNFYITARANCEFFNSRCEECPRPFKVPHIFALKTEQKHNRARHQASASWPRIYIDANIPSATTTQVTQPCEQANCRWNWWHMWKVEIWNFLWNCAKSRTEEYWIVFKWQLTGVKWSCTIPYHALESVLRSFGVAKSNPSVSSMPPPPSDVCPVTAGASLYRHPARASHKHFTCCYFHNADQ